MSAEIAGFQGRPRASEFVFARLRYDSGDWDYNPKVAANILNSVVEYTSIPVYPEEVVIAPSADDLLSFPFLFMTGHKLVRFSNEARARLRAFVEHGGLLFSDDCNHDVNGLYARSFEQEMKAIFGEAGSMPKLPTRHPIYRSLFTFEDGPPATSHELNGWGDEIVTTTCGPSSTVAWSACCTAIKTTVANGTTTGGINAFSGRTTRSSRSTSSSTR